METSEQIRQITTIFNAVGSKDCWVFPDANKNELREIESFLVMEKEKLYVSFFCHNDLRNFNRNSQCLLLDFSTIRKGEKLIDLFGAKLAEARAEVDKLVEKKQAAEVKESNHRAYYEQVKVAFQPQTTNFNWGMFKDNLAVEYNASVTNMFNLKAGNLNAAKTIKLLEYLKGFDFNAE